MLRHSFLALLVSSFGIGAFAATEPKICGMKSGQELLTVSDSINESARARAVGIASGIATLEHFPAIQAIMKSPDVAKVCVSGIVVGRNAYQYNLDLITIETESLSGEKLSIPLLLQTASIQAYEGPGAKRMWLGFGIRDLVESLRKAIAAAELKEIGTADPSRIPTEIGLALLPQKRVDPSTRSYVHIPGVDSEWSTYLVSQLRVLGGINPFATQYLLDTAVVQINKESGIVRAGRLDHFFAVYQEFLAKQESLQPQDGSTESFVKKLQELGR